MPYLANLANVVRTSGLTVVEAPGWRERGHGPFPGRIEVVVGHHTATPAHAPGDYPSLRIVTEGRSDLPGPLCNLGLGRSGTVYVVAAGVAWHAGKSAHAGFVDLNNKSIGIEAEHPGTGPWPDEMLDAYPRLVAALCWGYRLDPDRYVSHRGCALPPGRKPDPAGITDDWMRATVRSLLATEGDDDDMTDEDRKLLFECRAILAELRQQHAGTPEIGKWPGWPTWQGGTEEKLTLLDLARRGNVESRQAWLAVKRIEARLANLEQPAGGGMSEADVARVAEAVVALLGNKIGG